MAEWRAEPKGDGRWALSRDGRPRGIAWAATDAAGRIWVHVDGQVALVDEDRGERVRSHAAGVAPPEAPMPAQVVTVLVGPGTLVAAGDTLVVLEAMKMELPIRAGQAGRVTAVHCAAGDRVAPGRALVDIAPIEAVP